MGQLFGTDGVRGIANQELTVEIAMKLGQAGAYVLTRELNHKPTILVGCDTRISGGMLANALIAGMCSVGANVVFVGVVPTPAVAYLIRECCLDGGVMVSASHNPMQFNGIKFFDVEGFKLTDTMEDEIERLIFEGLPEDALKTGEEIGMVTYDFDAKEEYVLFSKACLGIDLTGLRIVIDCAEGASYYTAIRTLEGLGAAVIPLHTNPNGININKNCGSTDMREIQKAVVVEKADLGLAFDGDADRMLAVDEKGNIVDGDMLMAICGNYLKEQGRLENNVIVSTVMSNLGFQLMCEEKGIRLERTKVGDRYVLERMEELGAVIGGEQSGHIIFLEENTTGDGLLSALHLLEVMVKTEKPLSELAGIMQVLPQVLVNAKVENSKKEKYMEYPEIVEAIKVIEDKFAGEGRVLIRPSGTEPLIRVMIEGKDQTQVEEEAQKLAELVEKVLG